MSISIVIPLYNKEDYVEECLASLACQTRLPDEVIVVDDASTDRSPGRARSGLARLAERGVPRTELLSLPVNKGPSAARNSGLDHARGEVLAFLDADDRWREDCCSEILRCLQTCALHLLVLGYHAAPHDERFPNLAALSGETVPLAGTLHRLPRATASAGKPAFIMGRASNVAVRRAAIGDERFVEGRHLNENIDFWYRIAKSIERHSDTAIGLLAEPVIHYRISPGSLSHRRHADWRDVQVPPSLDRYRHSDDADDRRLCGMIGRRWLHFAMHSLPDDAQRRAFCAAHGDLLARFGIELPPSCAAA